MSTRALVAAVTVLVAGCSGDPGPVSEPAEPSPTGSPSASAREIVEHPDARLYAVDVTRSRESVAVTSMWSLEREHGRHFALTESDDGFRTGRYVTGGNQRLQRAFQQPRPEGAGRYQGADVDLGRLMPWPVTSLAADVLAVVGGGDGATLFPFERVVASVDAGTSWTRFDVPRFDGAMAYSSGQVVTADGRLVALLDHFSDDRRNRPGERHHGLWTSSGADWSSYRPLLSRMMPRPTPPPGGWSTLVALGATADPDPVIWVTTWDHRLYVSTDGAATFHEIAAR